jgi:SAM-dependent methyltransferase
VIRSRPPLEDAACPLCGARRPDSRHGYEFPPFAVVRCQSCSLWYLSPRLPESEMLAAYGRPEYYLGGSRHGYALGHGTYPEQEQSLRSTFARFARRLVVDGLTGGRLLEIGAGYGYLLDALRLHFASTTATDLDPTAVDRLRSAGTDAVLGGPEQIPSSARFDLIVAVGVIEHVYRPEDFVTVLRERLAPAARLVLATPLMESSWLRLLGRRWPSFKVPEHVAYYTPDTLAALVRGCGATAVRTLPYPHAFPLGLLAGVFGMRLPAWLARRSVWIPATMFAMVAAFSTAEAAS